MEPDIRAINEAGIELEHDIVAHFEAWPRENETRVWPGSLPQEFLERVEGLRERIYTWFNRVATEVLPYGAYDRTFVEKLLRRASASVAGQQYYDEYRTRGFRDDGHVERFVDVITSVEGAEEEAKEVFRVALRMVRTVPTRALIASSPQPHQITSHVANTAFILMWMDPARPELVDVHDTFKRVFASFGIAAIRADDVEHQDKITDVILDNIAHAEFLVADVSGERPNVYYEIGYAHALGKRPILFRRSGTALHFDLSVHNVPEYSNLKELRDLLTRRLQAITGREPHVGGGDA